MRVGGALIAFAALWIAAPAAAQDDEPICADRPGLATPTCTVPAGMVQLETTFVDWTRDRDQGVRTTETSVGDTAIKIGLTERLHLELVVFPYVRLRSRDGAERQTAGGFGDLEVAAKYRLTNDSAPVQVAVRPVVKIPTARRSLGNREVEGGVVVPIEYAIPRSAITLALSPQLDLNADSDGRGHHLATGQVIGIGLDLTSRLSASAEVAGYWDFDPAGTVRQYALGASAGYLVSSDVQLDAGVNLGLNRAAPDVQLYSGIAFRF